MDMQKMIDAMNEAGRIERSKYHVTLGELLERLSRFAVDNPRAAVMIEGGKFPGNPHSYRGHYSDLAFEPTNDYIDAGRFVALLETECLDKTFEGYKGGDFVMSAETPLWISFYGTTAVSEAIIDTEEGVNQFNLITKGLEKD